MLSLMISTVPILQREKEIAVTHIPMLGIAATQRVRKANLIFKELSHEKVRGFVLVSNCANHLFSSNSCCHHNHLVHFWTSGVLRSAKARFTGKVFLCDQVQEHEQCM